MRGWLSMSALSTSLLARRRSMTGWVLDTNTKPSPWTLSTPWVSRLAALYSGYWARHAMLSAVVASFS
jgi:hypothetical protein